jgi:hypothetical protein
MTAATEPTAKLTLRQVRREFPQFEIWREAVLDRPRFIARAQGLGIRPHTVVTADLAELRDALAGEPAGRPEPGGAGRGPNIARVYSYLAWGKDHGPADRAAADSLLARFPEARRIAKANREFVTSAVARAAAGGIGTFVDIGAGLPSPLNVHQVARLVNPAAVTCYADCDPLVVSDACALLAGEPRVSAVLGDLRDPAALLADPAVAAALDRRWPDCLILASVLHFLTAAQADAAVAALTQAAAGGSYLIVLAGTSTGTDPALLDCLRQAYAGTSVITARPEARIAAWLHGWELLPPGLADVRDWHTGGLPRLDAAPPSARFLAALARKPHPAMPGSRGGTPA